MRVLSKYTRQILPQNAGRDLDRLTLKLALLRKDPFAFFRGTNPLFLEFLPRGHALLGAPCVLSISDGKPRWVERSLAQGVFRALLRRAINRTRRELLARFTKRKDGERCIRNDGIRSLRIGTAERPRLKRLLAKFAVPGLGRPFFKLRDASRRIAGCGSLGLARYILLVNGRGSPDQNFALDLKFAAPSAVADWLAQPQPRTKPRRILQAVEGWGT
jgi:uncharacterized protein (DUF2252 family)